MKNILFVSIAFPPKSDAEGLQVAKYLKHMVKEGASFLNVDAVTSKSPTLNMPYDASLEPMRRDVRQTIELPIYENRYSNFLIRKIMPWAATMPDPKFSFHMQARRVTSQLNVQPDLIYSRSFPLSSALLAYKLKREYGVPWVMHLSDLWVDCPEQRYSGISRLIEEKLERRCFEAADVVCVTSEKTRAFYLEKYRQLAPRIEFFPNVFDLEDAASAPNAIANATSNGKYRIVHTGSLVGLRSPAPFLKALSRLDKDVQDILEVIFVGPVDAANLSEFKKCKLPFVRIQEPVEYKLSLELQRSADLLLLIDLPVENPDLRVFFPSKLLDYILSGRPILALTDAGSEVEGVIKRQKLGQCLDRDHTEEIASSLTSFVRQANRDQRRSLGKAQEIYSAQYNAARLVHLFRELIGGLADETSYGGELWSRQPSVSQ